MARIDGGTKWKDRLKSIQRAMADKPELKVGFLENATYPDGTSVALIAAIQNFGAPRVGIPPRPFFSNVIARDQEKWPEQVARLLKAENYNAERALALMGESIQGEIRESIIQTNSPPLKPATVDRKGFEKPLIDTSHMLNSVDYIVVKGA